MTKPSRKRVLPSWQPEWSKTIESWTSNQIRKNLWRFDQAIDCFDDVLQDARILFFTIGRKYPVVNQIEHYFALYKTSLARMFIDKSRKRQKSAIDQCLDVTELPDDMQLQGIPNYGYFNMLLEEMPDELKVVLKSLTTGRIRLRVDRTTPPTRPRENLNMRLKRRLPHLGLDDPAGDLKRILRYN